MSDVVVTGLGVVSPVGSGVEDFWKALLDGRSGAGRITRFDPSEHTVRIACEVDDFDASGYMSPREIKRSDRYTQFGVVAAAQAWESAGCAVDDVAPERSGVIIGSSMGGVETIEREWDRFRESGPQRVNPMTIVKYMSNEATALIAMRFSLRGPSYMLASACATGAHVIGEGARMIRAGIVDRIIVGASEAAITPLWVSAFARMGAISRRNDEPQRASRPFDAERDGFVFGEGGGAMILESKDLALSRGADILCEVVGYGATTDAHHLVEPHPDGIAAAEAMRVAMKEAGADPSDVDYINAHGSSTALNDRIESKVIKDVLGPEAMKVPVSSTKSQHGHLLGAAGAVEAIATILALRDDVIPATMNLENPDPDCDLDYVAEGPRSTTVSLALSNSFGLGGHNACLAFKAV